jgi:hypothetical protein
MRALTTVALRSAMAPAVRAASPARDTFVVFLDAAGQRHAWSEMRGQAAKLLAEPRATSIAQPISKVSLTRDDEGWKQQSREQLGRPRQRVDEPAG